MTERVDATAAHVFATLCHLTGGERAVAERLLVECYLTRYQPGQPHDALASHALVDTAHRIYLATMQRVAQPTLEPVGAVRQLGEHDWLREQWASRGLTNLNAQQRAALHLVMVEGRSLTAAASIMDTTVDETNELVTQARGLLGDLDDGGVREAFIHTEVWLDDTVRERIEAALTERDLAHSRPPRRSGSALTRRNALVVGAVVGILAALVAHWMFDAGTHDGTPITFDVPTASAVAPPLSDSAPLRESTTVLDAAGNVVSEQEFGPDGTPQSSTVFLANDLTDIAGVHPDAIVRYDDGSIGVSWTGPCNRPAAEIRVTIAAAGAELQLDTGAFAVDSCVGMPSTWTALIRPQLGAIRGPIVPVTDGAVDTSFTNFSSLPATATSAAHAAQSLGANSIAVSSALVDRANRPWAYVSGSSCTVATTSYQSPVGPIFEVVRTSDDATSSSPSPFARCFGHRLVGPDGARFPQPVAADTFGRPAPVDCHGPYGSATDVPAQRPFTTQSYDGDWSTWDNCLVNSDVIHSKSVWPACGWTNVRVVRFADTLGDRIGPVARTLTYVRDPDAVVPGERPAFIPFAALPVAAYDTGIRFGVHHLYLVRGSTDVIYLVTGAGAEQWSRLTDPPDCSGL